MSIAMSSQYLGVSDLIAHGNKLLKGEQIVQVLSTYWNNLADIDQKQLDIPTVKIVMYDITGVPSTPLYAMSDSKSSQIIRDALNLSWGEAHHQLIPNRALQNNGVAIIGISCRFPGSNNAAEFWNFLKDGGDGICAVPRERLENSKLLDPELEKFHGGFLKCPIDEFDAKFFEISPREAVIMDPQQRLLLEVSWEALENAGINPLSLRGSNTVVFSGIWQMEYGKFVTENTSTSMFHNVFLGNSFSSSSARISNFLGLNGPNMCTESGCASSLLALHLAIESLKRGETDVAIVAGANLITNIGSWDGSPLLAKDWHCKTFDEKADGYARGEGIAVLVLKRVPDALKSGDRIRGILRGLAVSSDGTTSSFGTPNKACQEIAIREALKNAGVHPEEVDYIEAHGTGTPVGDPVEFGAISANYACERAKPLVISSVKTNIGHTESTAGLAGIIKVILAMEHETIPPHRNFDILNPKINLNEIPAVLPLREMPWKRDPQRVRLAGVSAFGISGTNVHVLLEEPPKEQKLEYMVEGPALRISSHILTLSAKTQNALADLRGIYLKYLKRHPEIDLGDLTFTLNTGRANFKHRLSVVAENISDLTKAVENNSFIRPTLKDSPKIAFVFTESGPQFFGMANTLYRSNLVFRNSLDKCVAFVKEKCGIDFMEGSWKKKVISPSPDDMSNKLSIFSVQYSFITLLASLNVKPEVVVGHGVGEFAAAVASGIMNLKDALILLIVTSPFIATFPEERMLALKQSSTAIKYQIPKCKYISGNSRSISLDGEIMRGSYWLRLAKGPGTLKKTVEALNDLNCNTIVGVGIATAFLISLGNISAAKDILKLSTLEENKNEWAQLLGTLGHLYTNGIDINWKTIYTPEVRRKLDLPTYPFQREKYWINILDTNEEPKLYSLLGRKFPLASSKDTIYINKLKLADFPYIRDHIVVNHVIMPGAGFLEIILEAGSDVLLNGSRNGKSRLRVTDFVVEAAFEMEEDKLYDMQVVASPIDQNSSFQITVYILHRPQNNYNNEKQWRAHASAKVDTFVENSICEMLYNTENIENIKSRCITEISPTEFYKKCQKVGVNLGGPFQSISSMFTSGGEAFVSLSLEDLPANSANYLYHPVILDALIQAFWWKSLSDSSGLSLPIGVEGVYVFQNARSELAYAHVQWGDKEKEGRGTVALYNKANELLVLMVGIQFVQTSIQSFLNAINSAKNKLPELYEEVWRPQTGSPHIRVDLSIFSDLSRIMPHLERVMEDHMKDFDPHKNSMKDEYVRLFLQKICTENLNFVLGKEYSTSDVTYDSGISLTFFQLFNRIIDIFAEDGFVIRLNEEQWKLCKQFPSLDEIGARLKEMENILIEYDPVGTTVLTKCLNNLWNILVEKVDPVAALFDREDLPLLDIYSKGLDCRLGNARLANSIRILFNDVAKVTPGNEVQTLRIIEIGGGSASSSVEILTLLKEINVPYEYTFTDISSQFMKNARNLLSEFVDVEYKVLDIEKDPSAQGFVPHYYDVVVASNVIHATEILSVSVSNMRKLLISEGILILQEQLQHVRSIDAIFGILDGYWKFSDTDVRGNSPMASKVVWDSVFFQNGFEISHNLSNEMEIIAVLITRAIPSKVDSLLVTGPKSLNRRKWIIFGEDPNVDQTVAEGFAKNNIDCILVKHSIHDLYLEGCKYVNMLDESILKDELNQIMESNIISGILYILSLDCNQETSDQSYLQALHLCKFVAEGFHSKGTILMVTRGAVSIPNQGTVRPAGAVLWGMMKSLMKETPHLSVRLIDLDPDVVNQGKDVEQIIFESLHSKDSVTCYRGGKRFVPRYISWDDPMPPLFVPKGRFIVQNPKSKRIEDVSLVSGKNHILKNVDVEIAVKAFSFNFKDLLLIINPEIAEKQEMHLLKNYSGVVSSIGSQVTKFKVGDEVFCIGQGSYGSHFVANEKNGVFHKPSYLDFSEASTVPIAYITADLSLIKIANLSAKETVLIHVATGGVGLFAIQIANTIGAKLIVTAGSHRKRGYLRSLGINHVFHSRDLSYGKHIKRVTNGRGVDVVINSLTGPGFIETTLENCAQNARFIEIGKLNIWQEEDIQRVRPDVIYTILDVEIADLTDVNSSMARFLNNDVIKPVPYVRFCIKNIREAYKYLLDAKHIGKIVISLPDESHCGNRILTTDQLFSERGSYLITGGLGGIGLEVAKWMAAEGAKYLVLVGRSLPNVETNKVLDKLRDDGCLIAIYQVDISDFAQCNKLFQSMESSPLNLGPLKGVIHSAGILSDAALANQTWEKFQTVFNPKIKGCWNLHNLTKEMHLEHFVLFSSITTIIAPMGQSNYVAANSFLDAFAHYRNSIGLPAQTINWSVWSEVGFGVKSVYASEKIYGEPLTNNQGIATLKFIMTRPDLRQLGVVQLTTLDNKLRGPYFSELFTENDKLLGILSSEVNTDNFWKNINSMTFAQRVAYIQTQLSSFIKNIIKLGNTETIAENQTFSELGMDSLMTLQLRNKIQNIVGKNLVINSSLLMGHKSLGIISMELADATLENPRITINEISLRDLVKHDSVIPKDINGVNDIVIISEIRNILLIGVTGQMAGFFLKELLQNPVIKVVCLIKASSPTHAHQRLAQNLAKFNLAECINFERVSVVVGDISVKQFGIPDVEYNTLSKNIDGVFHLAAKVNLFDNYESDEPAVKDIRSVNVLGTLNVLRFAANIKIKRVFFSSSMIAINKLSPDGLAYEDFPEDDNYGEGIAMGYALTKFVCEKLIKQAISRGIPCTVVRYHTVFGNSVTGHFAGDLDLAINTILIAMKLGVLYESFQRFYIMPADNAAQLSVQIFFNEKVPSGIYNLWQHTPIMVNEIVNIVGKMGYPLEIVSDNEFIEKLQTLGESPFSQLLNGFENGSNGISFLHETTFMAKLIFRRDHIAFHLSEKLKAAIPNITDQTISSERLFERWISYAESSGILKNLEIFPNIKNQTKS